MNTVIILRVEGASRCVYDLLLNFPSYCAFFVCNEGYYRNSGGGLGCWRVVGELNRWDGRSVLNGRVVPRG